MIELLDDLNDTHAHKESNQDKHGGEVDCDNRLKITILVEISTVADDIENKSGDEDIHHNTEQLSSKSDLHRHSMGVVQVNNIHGNIIDLILCKQFFTFINNFFHIKIDEVLKRWFD